MNDLPITQLLNTYSALLDAKKINDEQCLSDVLSFDFEKVLHALIEVQTVNVNHILNHFFSNFLAPIPLILTNTANCKLSHVGFEICVPLDIVMESLPYWLEKLSSILSKPVILKKELRFAASAAFQSRVNAKVEILCLWLQIDEQLLMLELFDIAHPITNVLPSGEKELNSQALAMRYLFENDSIWHYSISVGNKEMVQKIHDELTVLMVHQPNYKLAYQAPIQNKYDGSFHTKLINTAHHLELEFVTHQTD